MFDDLAKQASHLPVEDQAAAFFRLTANLNSFYKFEFDNARTLNRQQAIELVSDSLQSAE